MNVTLSEAFTILKLPDGAPLKDVESQFRILAYQYQLSNSIPRLQQACCAYKRITSPDNSNFVNMDMATMKDLFKNIIFGSGELENGNGVLHDADEDSLSGSDYSDDDVYRAIKIQTQVQSDQIAKELISEEEKEKRKAEKRRAKKKKRREKKKLEKELEHTNRNGATDGRTDTANGIRSSDEGEGIDPNAAFVKKGKNKKKGEAISTKSDNTSSVPTLSTSKKNDSSDPGEGSNAVTKKSHFIASSGNEAAHLGDYPAAIKQFTEAIRLQPNDYRFFGNRSYCYDRIMQFDKALADADKCIELSPEWPKGYFRKGRALAGLKLFADAEKSFVQVLKLDRTCEEASKELTRVRTQQLIDMGFSPKDSEQAVLSKNTLQQALDLLLAGVGSDMTLAADDVYVSDDEDVEEDSNALIAAAPSYPVVQHPAKSKSIKSIPQHNLRNETFSEEKKMDPTNPEGLTALWVGNVLPSVKESDLQNLFNRYGHVSSVRCLPEKYCAFVNFKSKEAAGKAMNALQNHDVQGQHLLIKFPDNPIAPNGVSGSSKPVKHVPPTAVHKSGGRVAASGGRVTSSGDSSSQKVSGPVNGDECYFWRTTGCQFGSKCRWKHLPESRGIDKKPWQRVK